MASSDEATATRQQPSNYSNYFDRLIKVWRSPPPIFDAERALANEARHDRRHRELLIFDAESTIWQQKLRACVREDLLDHRETCRLLYAIVAERKDYVNARYREALRPRLTPGLVLSEEDVQYWKDLEAKGRSADSSMTAERWAAQQQTVPQTQ